MKIWWWKVRYTAIMLWKIRLAIRWDFWKDVSLCWESARATVEVMDCDLEHWPPADAVDSDMSYWND